MKTIFEVAIGMILGWAGTILIQVAIFFFCIYLIYQSATSCPFIFFGLIFLYVFLPAFYRTHR